MSPDERQGAASLDALLTAARGAPAAWLFVVDVQSALADIESALEAEQWAVGIAACRSALRSVVHCRMVLDGLGRAAHEGELDLHVVLDTGGCADLMNRASAVELDRYAGDARDAVVAIADEVRAIAARLESELPLRLPAMRTPRGYFPGVRAGRDLATLRERVGLPELNWMEWL